MLPLPPAPYELARFKTVKVHIDYHVEVDAHYYSVPHALVGHPGSTPNAVSSRLFCRDANEINDLATR
jgi:hypothetical protein